ncbi:MBL fold metallo-hydrolase [Jeotgalibacillus soli]|uniref:Hydroxyacylglutathione hydrolase n=1 Tax=Jeotgalibacillus soli TaxID=889306 RepID=A0A0C2VK67_9BACL|nr:MBL fold metallo-hydrolase [Jeotgalibacillus soli]KIL44393.1 hydroxyacylglutathione hydrolase [Jeotgalibacillus soli]
MEWIQLPLGPLQTNAYIIYNSDRKCLIIDPGEEAQKIRQFIQKKGLQPQAILLTHAHFDHIGAVDPIRQEYRIPVYLHQAEKKWLSDPSLNGSTFFAGIQPIEVDSADKVFPQSGEISIGDFSFTLLETPGHSPGGVSFYFHKEGFVIVGDTLFEGSIGRTDLPGGKEQELLKSIHNELLTLPEDTYVLPGHGGVTSIAQEMDHNPFINGF